MSDSKSNARWTDAILITIALWLFVLLIFLPVIFERHATEGWGSIALDSATIFVSMGFALLLFALFRATIAWPGPGRFIVLAATGVAIALSQTIFDLLFTAWVADNLEASWAAIPRNLSRATIAMLNYVCVFTVNGVLFQLAFARRSRLTQERQLAAAQSAAQRAQLEALRLQLNPHFLFNTLNAISAMIVTKRNEEAEQMTDKLSSFLRASLAFDPTMLVSLDEELAVTEDYLEIEAVRFGERLIVEVSCAPEARDVLVPGLLIQPLVENAIKYGVAPSRHPVTIAIDAEVEDGMLCVTISDDGAAEDVPIKTGGAGVGLKNVRRRLDALYGDRATLAATPGDPGFTVRLCLPSTRPDWNHDGRTV